MENVLNVIQQFLVCFKIDIIINLILPIKKIQGIDLSLEFENEKYYLPSDTFILPFKYPGTMASADKRNYRRFK